MGDAGGNEIAEVAEAVAANEAGKEAGRLYVYPLPNYHVNGHYGTRARGALECVLPHTEDYGQHLKKIVAPGWYVIELRRGSILAETWTTEVRPVERSIEPEKTVSEAVPGAPAVPADLVALVESALERQREMFADELEALREELVQSKREEDAPKSFGERVAARLEEKVLEQMVKTIDGEGGRDEKPSSNLSDDDELALRLLRGTDLLPRVVDRITRTLGTGGEETPPRRGVGERLLDTLEASPVLQSKAARAADRVLSRYFPAPVEENESDDEGDDEARALDVECSDYIVGKCAADEPITFDDEPVRLFRQAAPDMWKQLVEILKAAPVEFVIGHFSNSEEYPAWYGMVLKSPHASRWITDNLLTPAKKLGEKRIRKVLPRDKAAAG
jgi:hypothetical protein